MKRVIAILLTLLLLLPMIGCKEAKNIDQFGVNIDDIERQMDEQSYAVTIFDIDSTEYSDESIGMDWIVRTEQEIVEEASFVAKCTLMRKPQIARLDYTTPYGPETSLQTMFRIRLDKVFYTDGSEKAGDIIPFLYRNMSAVYWEDLKKWTIRYYNETITPEVGQTFYIFGKRVPSSDKQGYTVAKAHNAAASLVHYDFKGIILQTGENTFEFSRTFMSLSEGGENIAPEIAQTGINALVQVKTGDLDSRMEEMLRQYGK